MSPRGSPARVDHCCCLCSRAQLEQAIEIFRVSGDTAGEGAFIAGLMSSMEAAKAGITIPERDEAKVRNASLTLSSAFS